MGKHLSIEAIDDMYIFHYNIVTFTTHPKLHYFNQGYVPHVPTEVLQYVKYVPAEFHVDPISRSKVNGGQSHGHTQWSS